MMFTEDLDKIACDHNSVYTRTSVEQPAIRSPEINASKILHCEIKPYPTLLTLLFVRIDEGVYCPYPKLNARSLAFFRNSDDRKESKLEFDD